MSVNESLWGNKSTWAQYRVHDTDITNVLISNNQTLESINGNVSQSPNIDLSCSPWGIGGGSWLCNTFVGSSWIQVVGENPYNKPLGYATQYYNCDKNAGKQHPMILLSNQDITGTQRNKGTVVMFSQNRYYPDANAEAPSYLGKQVIVHDAERDGYALKPILQFDYKNLILIPYVIAYKGSAYYQILLDDFCNNSADITKTDNIAGWREQGIHITGIGYKFAFGNAGNRNSTTDDENEIFNVATIRSLIPYDIKDTSKVNLPTPMGNIPQEAYYVTISSCQNLNGNDVVLSTMLSNTNFSRRITMYRDVNAQPFTYWYDGIARDNSNPFTPEAACYMTGGDNFAYEAHLYWSTDTPAYHNDALRYMYFDITDLSDDDVRKELWRQVAYLGFVFTKDHTQINGVVGLDNNLCMPVFTNGVTTGDYKQGEDVLTLPNFLWTTDVFDKNKYNPYNDGDKDDKGEDDFGTLNNRGGFNKFPTPLTCYMLSYEKFMDVVTAINDLYITDPDGNMKWELDFKGSNPSDYIVGAYASVCNIPHTSDTYPIKIGPVDLSTIQPTLTSYKISFVDSGYFDCGSVDITPYYDDFRDYAPYTSIELYLPLCGSVDIDTAYFMGHSLSITYYYDYTTMSCSACIYRDGITLYKVVNGSLGAQIPLTSLRMGEYQNTIHALENAEKQNEMRMASALVSMGISAAGIIAAPATGGTTLGLTALGLNGVKTGMETLNAHDDIQYQYEHKQPAIAQTGASDTQNGFCVGSMYPYLFIKRPKMIPGYNSDVYAHTIGYACNVNARIGDMSGYTVATNIDTSGIHATADEINAIKQAFSKGVYL